MSPAGQEVVEKKPPHPGVFLQRVVHEVPSLQDALTLYNTTKKERLYVGAALQVAEAGMSMVANTALPLATPLLNRWGGWSHLDQWACYGLDRVEQAAPIITQPTKEVVNQTRSLVLKTIAGQGDDTQQSVPPSTLSDALATRVINTAKVVAGTQAGMAVTGAAHRLLDTANAIVDALLPVEKYDHVVLDHDGRGGTFGTRLVVLKDKCRRRVKAKLSEVLQVTHTQPLNPDDLDITFGHMVELTRRLFMDWQVNFMRKVCASRVYQFAQARGTEALDKLRAIRSNVVAWVGTVWVVVADRAGRVLSIACASPAGPLVTAGLNMGKDMTKKGSEMARNGMDIWNAVLRYNIVMVRSSVLVADGVVRGTVKEVKDRSVDTMERMVRRGRLLATCAMNVSKKAVTDASLASLAIVTMLYSTGERMATVVLSMAESVRQRGINLVRYIWLAHARILIGFYTLCQKLLLGNKFLLYLSSLFGMPHVWLTAASCHGTEGKEHTTPCLPSSDKQGTPKVSSESVIVPNISFKSLQEKFETPKTSPEAPVAPAIPSQKPNKSHDVSPKPAASSHNHHKVSNINPESSPATAIPPQDLQETPTVPKPLKDTSNFSSDDYNKVKTPLKEKRELEKKRKKADQVPLRPKSPKKWE